MDLVYRFISGEIDFETFLIEFGKLDSDSVNEYSKEYQDEKKKNSKLDYKKFTK